MASPVIFPLPKSNGNADELAVANDEQPPSRVDDRHGAKALDDDRRRAAVERSEANAMSVGRRAVGQEHEPAAVRKEDRPRVRLLDILELGDRDRFGASIGADLQDGSPGASNEDGSVGAPRAAVGPAHGGDAPRRRSVERQTDTRCRP